MATASACECGCGHPVNIASRTDPRRGQVKGQPMRFAPGHNPRMKEGSANLVGRVFGLWTVVASGPRMRRRCRLWSCVCACGTTRLVIWNGLRDGSSRSCGCTHWVHGHTANGPKGKEYQSWSGAKNRCLNPGNHAYRHYGGRGITMCAEWLNNFPRFLADMGSCPAGMSLDRFPDNNGNYEPGNCRWATTIEQLRNKRNNRLVTYNGETLCLIEWVERLGLDYGLLKSRLSAGWDVTRAFTEPPRPLRAKPRPATGGA